MHHTSFLVFFFFVSHDLFFPVSFLSFCISFKELNGVICLTSTHFSLNCVLQGVAACLPSMETVRRTTPGRIAGTWWHPCQLGGHEWAWQPLGTDSMLSEGE